MAALRQHAHLLDGKPVLDKVDVLADELSTRTARKGLLLRLPIKESHAQDAEVFLQGGRSVVAGEPATTAWFAIRFEDGDYGVFDVFPDKQGRRAHLSGESPQRLARHGLPWLAGLPRMALTDVLVQRL